MSSDQRTKNELTLNSPMPFLRQLFYLVFGRQEPDNFTRLSFFIIVFYWLCFLIWSVASYLTISFRELIMEEKKIPVEQIINARGLDLSFEDGVFLERLITIHGIAIVCWLMVFVGLVLLWRKSPRFILFIVPSVLFYGGMLIFYMSPRYFKEDITFFDKSGLVIVLATSVMHYFMLKREQSGGSINLFEEDDE
jgi:hypothetical protein